MDRILLIEDDPGTQIIIRNRLEDLGHEVVAAPTGAMGLMEARAARFDLFLVDIGLGSGIDGYEVCRRLKATPQIHSIPVVLISGQVRNREELHKGYQAGCQSYLVKGEMTLLEDVVRAMLRIKSLQDDLGLQNRMLEEQNRRLSEERQRGRDLEVALRESGSRGLVFRELAAGRPDGSLLVDADGIVRFSDRGARDALGKDIDGKNLAMIAPDTGLEAFVRDARTEPREGYRFDVSVGGGRALRSLSASVIPMVPASGGADSGLRTVLLLDAGKRRVAAEVLRLEEHGVPRREMGPLLEAARSAFHPSAFVGESAVSRTVRSQIVKAAATDSPVLLRGDSGTGKEWVARCLHFTGSASGPFVPVNCAALAPSLLEAELFGYVKGAFAEAVADRPGLLQQAHNGTLFLDVVEELPVEIQAKLLRVLEEGEVFRVGSKTPESVDVRIIAAAGPRIEEFVDDGTFRKDLYFRLNVVDIHMPGLRDRDGDVEVLARHFVNHYGVGRDLELSPDAAWILHQYGWPGNIRELENCIERACAMCEGDTIEVTDLSQPLVELHKEQSSLTEIPAAAPRMRAGVGAGAERMFAGVGASGARLSPDPLRGEEVSLQNFERMCLIRALEETEGDKLAAAKLLNVGKSTFYRKLKTHGIT